MKLLLHNQEHLYELLLEEATGDYVLDVVCGRVFMYGKQVKLTAYQIQGYHAHGVSVLDVIAEEIWKEEDRKLLDRRRLQYGAERPKRHKWQFWG